MSSDGLRDERCGRTSGQETAPVVPSNVCQWRLSSVLSPPLSFFSRARRCFPTRLATSPSFNAPPRCQRGLYDLPPEPAAAAPCSVVEVAGTGAVGAEPLRSGCDRSSFTTKFITSVRSSFGTAFFGTSGGRGEKDLPDARYSARALRIWREVGGGGAESIRDGVKRQRGEDILDVQAMQAMQSN